MKGYTVQWTIFTTHEKTCAKLGEKFQSGLTLRTIEVQKDILCRRLYQGWQAGVITMDKYLEMRDSVERQYWSANNYDSPLLLGF